MEMCWRCPLMSRGKSEPVDEGAALCSSKEWLVVMTGDYLQFGGTARAQYSVCSVYLLDGKRMLETKCYESFTWLWKEHSPAAAAAAADLTGNAKLGSLPGKGPSLPTHCPLSAQFLNSFLSPVWVDLLLEILFLLASILFLKVCSFVQPPNLSCKLDLQPVEMVELSTWSEGHRSVPGL